MAGLTSRPQAAVATHALKAASSKSFAIDPLDSPHSAAVGATLASFVWNLKTTSEAKAKLEPVEISLLGNKAEPSLESEKANGGRIQLDWETGKVYGEVRHGVPLREVVACADGVSGIALCRPRTLPASSWRRPRTA